MYKCVDLGEQCCFNICTSTHKHRGAGGLYERQAIVKTL